MAHNGHQLSRIGAACRQCRLALLFTAWAGCGHAGKPVDGSTRPLLGKLVYVAESPLFQGSFTMGASRGVWEKVAKTISYTMPNPRSLGFYEEHRRDEVICITADVKSNLLPHYYAETYLDPKTGEPLRAVRWKQGLPDVVFEYFEPGRVYVTKAKVRDASALSRLQGLFGGATEEVKGEVVVRFLQDPIPVGAVITDLPTTFFRLPSVFRNPERIKQAVRHCGIRKRATSIYEASFAPHETEALTFKVNGTPLNRRARRFSWTLSYVCPFIIPTSPDLDAIAATYFPGVAGQKVRALLEELAGGTLGANVGKTLALPVSPAVHSAVFQRSGGDGFERPYGLSEAGEIWFDTRTGIPLRLKGGMHGIQGEARLAHVDGELADLFAE
ncbi:MAG: hypothetical protein HOJ57_31035 [Lentisphaerae bacterium]|jgi:hypothetical protein|nr:hypothetical protein [Lentisphaerota bacterium]MBT4821065.1 hypothetical protein [Lentisphaerota bacterium]MBT5610416.1 hypothetical protein [Lentisphaerota bacterium]MBT7061670.1 hypothetical protein [Lentisphaerota bacterium]